MASKTIKHYEMFKDNTGEQFVLLDSTDLKIIELLKENVFINQHEIAEKIKLSQPVIHFRLQKLKTLLSVVIKHKYMTVN
jgi:DNA-binding Lrp family transcriptional regulator